MKTLGDTDTLAQEVQGIAAALAHWLASPDAASTGAERQAHARTLFEPVVSRARRQGMRFEVDALDGPEVDDATPLATLFTLRHDAADLLPFHAGLVVYGSHTALVTAEAGRAGCQHARLDPATGTFRALHEALEIPPTGPVRLLNGRRFGAALYRVLLEGGAVMGADSALGGGSNGVPSNGVPSMPDSTGFDAAAGRRIREEAATVLLDAAGGQFSLAAGFGSTGVMLEMARLGPGPALPPASVEPLFGQRGLFRP